MTRVKVSANLYIGKVSRTMISASHDRLNVYIAPWIVSGTPHLKEDEPTGYGRVEAQSTLVLLLFNVEACKGREEVRSADGADGFLCSVGMGVPCFIEGDGVAAGGDGGVPCERGAASSVGADAT